MIFLLAFPLLLLLLPSSPLGMAACTALYLIGCLIIAKTSRSRWVFQFSIIRLNLFTLFLDLVFAVAFYLRWCSTDMVAAAAGSLHLSIRVFLGGIGLALAAISFAGTNCILKYLLQRNPQEKYINSLLEKAENDFKRSYFLLLLIFTVLYIALLGGRYIWYDEAYTFGMMEHTYAEIWKITAADVHPPLYYFIMKVLAAPFGYSMVSGRIVSVIPCLILLAFGGAELKRLFSARVSLIFMLTFFLFPYALRYTTEIRMYSWAALFVFACGIFAYRCYEESHPSDWILFLLNGTAAAYTHYFALVSAGIIYGLLFLAILLQKRERFKAWLLAAVATVLLYLPWLKCFVEQLIYKVNNEYWIEKIVPATIRYYGVTVFGVNGSARFAALSGLSYLLALLYLVKQSNKKNVILAFLALTVPVGTVAVGVLASVLVRPVFVIRYVIPAIPILAFFLALALGNIKNPNVIAFALLVILLGGSYNYVLFIRGEYEVTGNDLDISFVAQDETVDCYVIMTSAEHAGVLSFYEKTVPMYIKSAPLPANPFKNQYDIADFTPEENDTVILMLNPDEKPSSDFERDYHIEYIGRLNEGGTMTDTYLLTK